MGDDQAGLIVAERLRRCRLPDTSVLQTEAPLADLADQPGGPADLLVVVDAAHADQQHPAGTVCRIDYRGGAPMLCPKLSATTHTLGVDAGLELAAGLGVLPEQVWLYVVFGGVFERGLELSKPMAGAIDPLVERIAGDVQAWRQRRPCTN